MIERCQRWVDHHCSAKPLFLISRSKRRRKQLRIAQQAYRKRKENTISSLQSRVHELETGIEDISHSFLSLSNLLIEEKLLLKHPVIASALQDIIKQCVSLAKAGSEETAEGTTIHATTPNPTDNDIASKPVLTQDNSESSTDVEDITRTAISLPQPATPPSQEQSILPFGLVMSSPTVQFPYFTPQSPDVLPSLDLISSKSKPERQWNVAQRLVRTCCRNAYLLLVDTPHDPRIPHIFGSMLSLTERNRFISGFFSVMQDKIGDATDSKANAIHALRSNLSMFSEKELQMSSRPWQIGLESVSSAWMDCNGVQKYLLEKQLIFEGFSDTCGRVDYMVSSLDITAFLKRESLVTDYSDRTLTFRSPRT